MAISRFWTPLLGSLLLGALLSACGGGGGGSSATTPSGTGGSTASPSGAAATIDATGGTLLSPEGVKVEVPAGAASAPVTIRVAKDATGAPPLPATGPKAAGDIFAITPHGQAFTGDVTVSLPTPSTPLATNEQLMLAKAELGGSDWVLLPTTNRGGTLQATINSFSFVVPVIVPFPQPLAQLPPLVISPLQATCDGVACPNVVYSGVSAKPSQMTVSFKSNGGQVPAYCPSSVVQALLTVDARLSIYPTSVSVPVTKPVMPSNITAGTYSFPITLPFPANAVTVTLDVYCGTRRLSSMSGGYGLFDFRYSSPGPSTGNGLVSIAGWPATLTVARDHAATLPATLFMQGVPYRTSSTGNSTDSSGFPNSDLQTLVRWERSDDGGTSWRQVASTQQIDGTTHTKSYPSGADFLAVGYWQAAHGLTATAADNGSLWRLTACWHDATLSTPDPCVTSKSLTLTVVDNGAAPVLTQQPRDTLVQTGQTASFSATADPTAQLPVTGWRWQSRPANSSGAWTDIAGATAATYTTGPLALADNGTQVRVVASNAAGSTASDVVVASVSDVAVAPTVSAPLALSVVAGSDAVFAVTAHGTEALSYQWLKNGSAIDSRSNASAASPVLRLPAVASGDAASYSVRVSNAAGRATSTAAALTVSPGVPAVVAPGVTTAPVDVTVHAGDSASFGVGVAGTGPFTYQWYAGSTAIPGANRAVLALTAVTATQAGSYHVTVSNSAGSVDSALAALTVSPLGAPATAPAITTDPVTLTALPQTSAVFAVAASGSGPLRYQWTLNGTPMVDGSTVAGSGTAVLLLSGVTAADAGSYRVQVSNDQGSVLSAAAQLVIVGAPAIAAQPADASVTEGDNASFNVTATGSFLRYLWLKNGEPIPGAESASYTTPALTVADSGSQYRVLAYNNAGVAFSRSATLTVNAAPVACTSGCISVLATGMSALNGIAVDSQGTVYTFDRAKYTLMAISPNGSVRAFAGSGSIGTANGTGTAASFVGDMGVSLSIDAADNLYLSQNDPSPVANDPNLCNAYAVRRITPAAVVTTLRPCQAANAVLAVADGTIVYVAVPTVYGAHAQANGLTLMSQGQLIGWRAGQSNGGSGFANGDGTAAAFSDVTGLLLDANGYLVVADRGNTALRKVTLGSTPTVSTLVGGPSSPGAVDGPLANASFVAPTHLAASAQGFYFVADGPLLRTVDLHSGMVTTLAGRGAQPLGAGQGMPSAPLAAASLNFPAGIGGLAWAGGKLYIASGDSVLVYTP